MGKNVISKQVQMVSRQIKRKVDEVFNEFGLTSSQALTLRFIYETSKHKKVYAKDIENEFNVRRASIAGIIQLMEQNQLIERKSEDIDARMKEIKLTEKALEKIHNIELEMKKLEKLLSNNVSEQELSIFFKVLNEISRNLLEES